MIDPVPREDKLEATNQDTLDPDNNNTLVTFSFTEQAGSPFEALSELRVFETRKGPLADDDVFYEVAHTRVEDGGWHPAPCQHRHERHPRLQLHRYFHAREQYESNLLAAERGCCRGDDN